MAVVGAGPGGLASAVTLGSYGVETLVVERRPSSLDAAASDRGEHGHDGAAAPLGPRGGGVGAFDRRRMAGVGVPDARRGGSGRGGRGRPADARAGGARQPDVARLPPAGRARADARGAPRLASRSVRLERGVELVALEREADGGHVLTLAGTGRAPPQVRARYVIGADGVRSRVREALGIAIGGRRTSSPSGSRCCSARRSGNSFATTATASTSSRRPEQLHPGRQARPLGVRACDRDAEAGDVEALTHDQLARWIRDAAGVPGLPVEIERAMPVAFGVGLAERFREGDAFLIGDAAHRVTPRGGTGLNTAIRDGFDIGWRAGLGSPRLGATTRLLDSYERERRPVAEFNTLRSRVPTARSSAQLAGLNADIGGRIAHVWVPRDGSSSRRSTCSPTA